MRKKRNAAWYKKATKKEDNGVSIEVRGGLKVRCLPREKEEDGKP